MVHFTPQLDNLVVGTGSLIELFGQVEVLVVEFGVVLSQLVQLLLQVCDDLKEGRNPVTCRSKLTVSEELLLEL